MKKKIVAGALLCGCLLSLSACNSKHSESKGKEAKTEQKETEKDSVDFLVGQWQMKKEGKLTDSTMEFGALKDGKGHFTYNVKEESGEYTPDEFVDKDKYRHVKIEAPNGEELNFKYKLISDKEINFVQQQFGGTEKEPEIILVRK